MLFSPDSIDSLKNSSAGRQTADALKAPGVGFWSHFENDSATGFSNASAVPTLFGSATDSSNHHVTDSSFAPSSGSWNDCVDDRVTDSSLDSSLDRADASCDFWSRCRSRSRTRNRYCRFHFAPRDSSGC